METLIEIKGVHCKVCKILIEDVCTEIEGVSSCSVNLTGERATITHDANVDLNELKEEIIVLEESCKTAMIVTEKNNVLGIIAVADEIKEDSPQVIQMLKYINIIPFMITGDNKGTSATIAKKVVIEHYFVEVLPEDKANYGKKLQRKGKVAMVGDEINDAPALVQTDIGIALGSGTDVAMKTGNVVSMKNSLKDVPKAIKLSKMTMSKIRQNMFWALIYNVIGIPIAAGNLYPITGWLLNPMFAGAAMALSSISVVSNSLLLRRKK